MVPLYLDPRSRTRRRAAVFGGGATASLQVGAGRRAVAGVQKPGEPGRQALFRVGGVRGPACEGRGEVLKLRASRAGSGHGERTRGAAKIRVLLRVGARPSHSSVAPDSAYVMSFQLFWLACPCAKPEETAIKRHENLPKRRTLALADRRKHPTGSCDGRFQAGQPCRRKFTHHKGDQMINNWRDEVINLDTSNRPRPTSL